MFTWLSFGSALPSKVAQFSVGANIFGRLKNEMFYPRDWKSTTIEVFIRAVHEYILWYNEKRIKMSLGSLSPIEYRESLGLIN